MDACGPLVNANTAASAFMQRYRTLSSRLDFLDWPTIKTDAGAEIFQATYDVCLAKLADFHGVRALARPESEHNKWKQIVQRATIVVN